MLKHFAAVTKIPYTPMVTIAGILIGFSPFHDHAAISVLHGLDPGVILLVFIPALIFESAYSLDWHTFRKQAGKILIMAGPIVLVTVALSALTMYYILGYRSVLNFEQCLLFGSIISATDPVAVVALLKELGVSQRLATIIEGESLLNDGTAMVLFLVLLDIVSGVDASPVDIMVKFVRLAGGGPLLGLLAGWIVATWLARINKSPILEANLTVTIAYLTFFIAESAVVHVSGILALVVLGIYTGHQGRARMDHESEHAIHIIWSYIGFCAETVIFLLAGLIMSRAFLESDSIWSDFYKTIALYFCLHLIRFACLASSLPLLRRTGYGLGIREVLLISYAGLRGAIGLTLALIVLKTPEVPKEVANLIMFHVSCMVLLTLLVNGTTTKYVIGCLGLTKETIIEKKNLCDFISSFKGHKKSVIYGMRDDMPFMRGVNWKQL